MKTNNIFYACKENDVEIIIYKKGSDIDEIHVGIQGTQSWAVVGFKDLEYALEEVGHRISKFKEKGIKIIDNYKHLKFKDVSSLKELKKGMYIQYCNLNKKNLKWEWKEVDSSFINSIKENGFSKMVLIRIPAY